MGYELRQLKAKHKGDMYIEPSACGYKYQVGVDPFVYIYTRYMSKDDWCYLIECNSKAINLLDDAPHYAVRYHEMVWQL